MMLITHSCTGCGSCAQICPQKCIQMKENIFGEITPHIVHKKCIHCGLCENTCPQNNPPIMSGPRKCYVAWSKEPYDWHFSASGGVGASILRVCLNNGIHVYCCDYDKNFYLKHFPVEKYEDIKKAQSSKYSQSDAFVVYNEIKEKLKQEKKVVFIGTPCQVAGLRKTINREEPFLVTVDLVCHGTPPTKYVRDHLRHLNLIKNGTKIRFRGEYDQFFTVWSKDTIIYKKYKTDDSYFTAFYANIISRKSCYQCQYAGPNRSGDITIGDFWGLKELTTIERKSERPSLILLNTDKGEVFFELVRQFLYFEERPCQEGILGNGRLNRPPGEKPEAKLFRALYPVLGFENALHGSSFALRVIHKLKGIGQN